MLPEGPLVRASIFCVILFILPVLYNTLIFPKALEQQMEIMRSQGRNVDGNQAIAILERFQGISAPVFFTLTLLFWIVSLLVEALVFHLSLMVFGGAKKSFESTYRVLAYSMGATALLSMIPCIGGLTMLAWQSICLIVGLSEQNGISRGRATAVVAAPGLLVIFCCCGFIGLGVFGFMSSIRG